MAESIQLTNLQLQDDILKNLLLGLQKQSQFYVLKINETGEINEERKNYEKELSDINKVLTELSSKALSYTVQELDNLRTQFNDKLIQLNGVIADLEINTLKIEFNSLTPDQKEFLRGAKGDRGEKGLNPYEFAVMFGFLGTETEYLDSLKGADGRNGLDGKDGTNGVDGQNGLDGKDGTNGVDGQNGVNGQDGQSLTFDMLTPTQLQLIANLVTVTPFNPTSILDRLTAIETALLIVPPVIPDNSNDTLITSFVPEKANFKYFADFEYFVPDSVETVWKCYKMKDNIFNIRNSYVLTYRVKINSEVFEFVYDMSYVGNGWEIISRTNDNTIIVDALWFNGGVRFNGDNFFVDFTFDSANGNFVPALDVALFVQCDNSIIDLVCLESSSDDAVVSVWLP